jgi:hypothetical protein
MKFWIGWLCAALCLAAGCASHELRCEGRLQPINAPAKPADATRDAADGRRAESP